MSDIKLEALVVSSPLRGWCASLDDSPDPVFREKLLGDGVSIDPTLGEVRAPFNGEVLTVPDSRHAINLRAENGADFLIHVGIDSVKLAGEGFVAHVSAGDSVEAGQLLLSFDLDKVLRQATSLKTPILLLSSDTFEITQRHTDGQINSGDTLFEVHPTSGTRVSEEQEFHGEELKKTIAVGLKHGIHARPAAALVTAIKALKATVVCQLGDKPLADASSPVALMSLGVAYGDHVTVTAHGEDATKAMAAFEVLLEPLAIEADAIQTPVSAPLKDKPESAIKPPQDGAVISAQSASPGLGMGKAFKLSAADDFGPANPGSVTEEHQLLDSAIGKVRSHLTSLAESGNDTGAEIAIAHLAMLDDPLITSAAKKLLNSGNSASESWRESINQAVVTLQQLDDQRMRERVDDLYDINLRVQRTLAGQDPGAGPKVPPGSIVLAENMLPSQLLELDPLHLKGICLAAGGASSHVAILALSRNIPMLVAAGPSVLAIAEGDELLIDAEFGELQVRPDAATASAFGNQIEQFLSRQQSELKHALDECRTTDGTRIHINANLASAADAVAAIEAGAEGCGLLRTEFAFMEKTRAPDIEEQLQVYRPIAEALAKRPLIVRTLDAGGDKPISYIDQQAEENPALGVRGIRLSLLNKDILRTQLQALLELSKSSSLQIMIPMVNDVHEVEAVREILQELAPSGDVNPDFRLGVMIETPAAALIADKLAKTVDFFSIGTNDLTQYTLCMDREESHFAADLDALHPAVLRLIKNTVDAANQADIPVGVCGGAAGDVLAAPILLGLGIRDLSMSTSLIARQKANLRQFSIEDCDQLADAALGKNSALEVRKMMRELVTRQHNKNG